MSGPPPQRRNARTVCQQQTHTASKTTPGGKEEREENPAKPRKQREGAKHGRRAKHKRATRQGPLGPSVCGVGACFRFRPLCARSLLPFPLSSSSFLFFQSLLYRFVQFCSQQPEQHKAHMGQARKTRAQRENPGKPGLGGFRVFVPSSPSPRAVACCAL